MENNFKKHAFTAVLALCVFSCSPLKGQEIDFPNPDVTISMDLQDAGLKDVLKIFSIQSGLNFISSEGVQERKITLYLDRVPIQQAMEKLFKANGLYYELDEDSNVFIVKDWGKPVTETVTKVFYLKYASVKSSALTEQKKQGNIGGFQSLASTTSSSSTGTNSADDSGITQAVKQLLSEAGTVIEDARTNSLIINDIPSKIPVITQLIAALDVSQPQVMLEVEMLDVSKNTVDKMGFKTSLVENPITLLNDKLFFGDPSLKEFGMESTSNLWGTALESAGGIAGTVVLGKTYAAILDFLRSQTDTKYLARPRIMTLNNETAKIEITTKEAVGMKQETSGSGTSTTTTSEAERYDTGVSLTVTPQISIESGEITMHIVPSVAEATQSAITIPNGNSSFWNPEVRTTRTSVRVKDGETIILGGLIRNILSQKVDKVPVLGNIPIVGALFRHKYKDKDIERELLIFITPHIIKDAGSDYARAKNAGVLTEREQDSFDGRSRQTAISTSLSSFERKGRIE
ncbi:MAG: secretin N-terminal domain-containing protein [Candidatus Omnitrophota bacterium]|jgi:type IV pilus assembly protein PilQ